MKQKYKFVFRVFAVAMVSMAMVFLFGRVEAAASYVNWQDQGIIYEVAGSDAYYPSVIYRARGFGKNTSDYRMWYSDGTGAVFMVESANGTSWGMPTAVTGLGGDAHHVQVVYNAKCFKVTPCGKLGVKYKMWYWDIDANLYSINTISYAESSDGITWQKDQAITQDSGTPLVVGPASGWNRGSYGPIDVIYKKGNYTMYFDGTDGAHQFTGLAHSADGKHWVADSADPVVGGSVTAAWDCADASFGTVYKDKNGHHYWYSGGGGDNGSGGCQPDPAQEGIGYAFSTDGITWVKDTGNPIFHFTDGVSYRNARVYTPAIIKDRENKVLKMYYTALSAGDRKKIGLASLTLPK